MDTSLTPRDAPHTYERSAEATETDRKAWLAVVTDTHPEYGYDRSFVAYQDEDDDVPAEGTAEVPTAASSRRSGSRRAAAAATSSGSTLTAANSSRSATKKPT